jgi:DNA-binding transcriptional regulator WhiA
MSFISEARKEMIELISSEKCCVKAFLFGVYKGSGYIALRKNQWWLGFRFTDEELLNKCFVKRVSVEEIPFNPSFLN